MKRLGLALVAITILVMISAPANAKKEDYIERFDAVAASVQGGRGGMEVVRFGIKEWSSEEERADMIAAFQKGGSEALVEWFEKAPVKAIGFGQEGRPYDLMYAFQFQDSAGKRTIVMATNRPINGLEQIAGTGRSLRYNISLIELVFEPGQKKGKGQMILGAWLTVKDGKLVIENAALQPIQLTSVKDTMKDK